MTTKRPPDIFLIILDALRADAVSCYGHPRKTTPAIDALAAIGAAYPHCYSTASWTLPSTASILTGLHPTAHRADKQSYRLAVGSNTIPQLLRDTHTTACIAANAWFADIFGLTAHFDHTIKVWERIALPCEMIDIQHNLGDQTPSHIGQSLAELSTRIVNNLNKSRTEKCRDHGGHDILAAFDHLLTDTPSHTPLFVTCNIMESHGPYTTPVRHWDTLLKNTTPADIEKAAYEFDNWHDVYFRRRTPDPPAVTLARNLYAAAAAAADDVIADILSLISSNGRFDDSLIIITSDHGEELLEHRQMFHGFSLYDNTIHVPLLIKPPLGRRLCPTTRTIQHTDLLPTICDAIDIAPPSDWQLPGTSLLSHNGDSRETPAFASMIADPAQIENFAARYGPSPQLDMLRDHHAIISGGLKYISTGQLFDLAADPGETVDLSQLRQDTARSLQSILDCHLQSAARQDSRETVEIDPAMMSRLQSLGYF